MTEKKSKKTTAPTIITLTLPEQDSAQRSGTLLIQRGDLAHIRQFTYTNLSDLTLVIKEAVVALAGVEADPPKDTAQPTPTAKGSTKAEVKPKDEEPTVDVPLKKGTLAVKISHLKIVGGETDAAAYRQAVLIAGRLIDGKLWDGKSPIRIDDVYAVQRKLKNLTDRDMSLFTLTDFVQIGDATTPSDLEQDAHDDATPEGDADDGTAQPTPLFADGQATD